MRALLMQSVWANSWANIYLDVPPLSPDQANTIGAQDVGRRQSNLPLRRPT